LKLEYVNDRKGKLESHEIRMIEEDVDDILNMFIDGYGEDLYEALIEYTKNILLLKNKLDNHIEELLSGNIKFIDRRKNEVTVEIIDNYYTGELTKNNIDDVLKKYKEHIQSR
jgi:hypothetical protein